MKDDMMSAEEAIQHIMKATGCSRRAARRKLARAIKEKKIRTRRVPVEPPPPMEPGPELERMINEEPENLHFPLGYFIKRFGMSAEEVLQELRSGRLVAQGSESAMLEALLDKPTPADMFSISLPSVHAWMAHPKTPKHLLEKVTKAISKPS